MCPKNKSQKFEIHEMYLSRFYADVNSSRLIQKYSVFVLNTAFKTDVYFISLLLLLD